MVKDYLEINLRACHIQYYLLVQFKEVNKPVIVKHSWMSVNTSLKKKL